MTKIVAQAGIAGRKCLRLCPLATAESKRVRRAHAAALARRGDNERGVGLRERDPGTEEVPGGGVTGSQDLGLRPGRAVTSEQV